MNVSVLKEIILMNEVEFWLKIVVLFVILRTYWVMCYICLVINVYNYRKELSFGKSSFIIINVHNETVLSQSIFL